MGVFLFLPMLKKPCHTDRGKRERNQRFDVVNLCLRLGRTLFMPCICLGRSSKTPEEKKGTLPCPSQQRQCGGPEDRPERHEGHETVVLGLVPEEHHAHPAAQSPAQVRHPQQRPLRDAAAPLALRLRLVHAIKDEAYEVDEEEV